MKTHASGWHGGYYWICGRIAITSTFRYNWMKGLQYYLSMKKEKGLMWDKKILDILLGHIKPNQGTIEGIYWTEQALKCVVNNDFIAELES